MLIKKLHRYMLIQRLGGNSEIDYLLKQGMVRKLTTYHASVMVVVSPLTFDSLCDTFVTDYSGVVRQAIRFQRT